MKQNLFLCVLAVLCVSSSAIAAEDAGTIYNPKNLGAVEWHSYGRALAFPKGEDPKIDRSFPIPVYFGFADRRGYTFGSVILHGSTAGIPTEDREALRQLAVTAKLHGAEAIIVRPLKPELAAVMQGKGPFIFVWAMAVKWGPAPL